MSASVLLVDDDPVFRRLARRMLIAAGLVVVAEAGTVAAAVVAARELRPSSDADAAGPEDVSRCGAAGFVPKVDLPGVALERLLAAE
jgi:CheY-like chemotaxis protein